jgi:hypothetical protein
MPPLPGGCEKASEQRGGECYDQQDLRLYRDNAAAVGARVERRLHGGVLPLAEAPGGVGTHRSSLACCVWQLAMHAATSANSDVLQAARGGCKLKLKI